MLVCFVLFIFYWGGGVFLAVLCIYFFLINSSQRANIDTRGTRVTLFRFKKIKNKYNILCCLSVPDKDEDVMLSFMGGLVDVDYLLAFTVTIFIKS